MVGAILAHNDYIVIVPLSRSAAVSSSPPDGNYTAAASADDLETVLDFLHIMETHVTMQNRAAGNATTPTAKYCSSLVKWPEVAEHLLPGGIGYKQVVTLHYC